MSEWKLNLHFFPPPLVSPVIPWGLADRCLPVQRKEMDKRCIEKWKIKVFKNVLQIINIIRLLSPLLLCFPIRLQVPSSPQAPFHPET